MGRGSPPKGCNPTPFLQLISANYACGFSEFGTARRHFPQIIQEKKQIILYLLFGDQPDVCFDSEIALIRAENNSSNLGSILLKAERKRDIVEKRILCQKKSLMSSECSCYDVQKGKKM